MVMQLDVPSVHNASLKLMYATVYLKYTTSIKIQNSKFELLCYLRRQKPTLSHSMMMQLDVHSVRIASLKLIRDSLL